MERKTYVIRDAEVIPQFKNFEGREKRNPKTGSIVNSAGNRNFSINIPVELAEEIIAEFPPMADKIKINEGQKPYIQINVSYSNPRNIPLIMVGTDKNRMHEYFEDDIAQLDWTTFLNTNLEFNISPWIDQTGIPKAKVWLKSLAVLITPKCAFMDEYKLDTGDIDTIPFE